MTDPILARIARHAHRQPRRPALTDAHVRLGYAELQCEIERISALLRARRVALLLPNGCAWGVLDLAVRHGGGTCIPLPVFFSDTQLEHVLAEALPDLVVTDRPARVSASPGLAPAMRLSVAGRRLIAFARRGGPGERLPPGTALVTYTSGTTGRPKGVRLSATAVARVAASLAAAVAATPDDRTLSLLPLSTLLESIGGLYAPLYTGAQACVPDLAECGLEGSSGVDPARLMGALERFRPSCTILVPELLKAVVAAVQGGAAPPPGLRFMAVGGAHSAPTLIHRARHAGLPVHAGYGLSEACSVVSLNLPGHDRAGSAGRPLPHARVRIAGDGEILVSGTLFDGYLGQAGVAPKEWPTGDLGHLDGDGYLHVTGRKRSAYATAYGRNVCPEWVEGELLASPAVLQAAVFGAQRPCNVAVLVPHPHAAESAVAAAVADANRRLPDYARVRRWTRATAPFSPRNGLASPAGTMHRDAVADAYATPIEALYREEERADVPL